MQPSHDQNDLAVDHAIKGFFDTFRSAMKSPLQRRAAAAVPPRRLA
jgi:hypothetical protein